MHLLVCYEDVDQLRERLISVIVKNKMSRFLWFTVYVDASCVTVGNCYISRR